MRRCAKPPCAAAQHSDRFGIAHYRSMLREDRSDHPCDETRRGQVVRRRDIEQYSAGTAPQKAAEECAVIRCVSTHASTTGAALPTVKCFAGLCAWHVSRFQALCCGSESVQTPPDPAYPPRIPTRKLHLRTHARTHACTHRVRPQIRPHGRARSHARTQTYAHAHAQSIHARMYLRRGMLQSSAAKPLISPRAA